MIPPSPSSSTGCPTACASCSAPTVACPWVGVAVVYDIGIRMEPQGRTGFAHLFEHLMFQGSANVAKLEHMSYVQGSGGTLNGSTHLDYTDYYEMLPSNALERALFLEADRMRGPAITEENLANQIDVVKEEIRVNVLNRPYGGFPWLKLPPVMFDTFPNAHDGYGSFEDLEAATVHDAQAFFDTYYAAGNAVLTVAGDFDVAEAVMLIERHFGNVPRRGAPVHPDISEPDLVTERRTSYADPRAPLPAVAAALARPRSRRRPRRLPAVRGARGTADRRRRITVGGTPDAKGPLGHVAVGLSGVHGRAVRRPRPHGDGFPGAPAG